MEYENKFVDTLRDLMDKRGLSISQTAKQAGFGNVSIQNWLYKGGTPNMESLIRLSKFFDVSIDYLVFGDSSK